MVKWWDVIMEGDMWALNCVFTALFIGERLPRLMADEVSRVSGGMLSILLH